MAPELSGADAIEVARACHIAGDLEGAIAAYRAIIDAQPENAEAWHLLGVAAHQTGEHVLACTLIESAISLAPARADYHNNLAQALRATGAETAARDALARALALDPAHAKALANLASLLRAQGQFAEALGMAKRAAAAAPADPEVHINLGNALKDAMQAEQREVGRKRWQGFPAPPRVYEAPSWQGEGLAGKTLLLYPEQGLGDTIQLVRYAPLARARGARVVLEAPRALVPLVYPLADDVIASGSPPPRFDVHASLADLPAIFATTLQSVPARAPYLSADAGLVETMRERACGRGKLRVGLNWSGNLASPVERFRRVPPEALALLRDLAGIDWVCLQKGPGGDALARPLAMIETGQSDLAETAALIETLDLVVTTDTAVAHLAGALAKPTFVLLHHAPDWRWMLQGAASPWYPSARLFRQAEPGNWAPVVAAVAEALRGRV